MITYKDTITLIETEPSEYRGNKVVIAQHDIPAIFIQATNFVQAGFQENIDADAICYVDSNNAFVQEKSYRLEGMYVLAILFDADADNAWYKIETVDINRDHLLENQIDNVRLTLKKTRPIPGVS